MSSSSPTAPSPSTITFQQPKVFYCLLRMFYIQNQSDTFIAMVLDLTRDFPTAESSAWISDLISQIKTLPVLGDPTSQAAKTTYVCDNLQLYLENIQAKISSGLPQL
jgi:hypothetical protein